MSSPNFNNITVIGCMLAYLEVFLSAHGSSGSAEHLNHAFLCNVRSVCSKSRLKNSSFSCTFDSLIKWNFQYLLNKTVL